MGSSYIIARRLFPRTFRHLYKEVHSDNTFHSIVSRLKKIVLIRLNYRNYEHIIPVHRFGEDINVVRLGAESVQEGRLSRADVPFHSHGECLAASEMVTIIRVVAVGRLHHPIFYSLTAFHGNFCEYWPWLRRSG